MLDGLSGKESACFAVHLPNWSLCACQYLELGRGAHAPPRHAPWGEHWRMLAYSFKPEPSQDGDTHRFRCN